MTDVTYLAERRSDLHSTSRWTQFAFAEDRLRDAVRRLVRGAQLPAGARVGDFGCGEMPYRTELPAGAEYVGIDLPGNPNATVTIGPDGSVPLPDGTFDLILSNQVLEHVLDPVRTLDECRRTLKPGGSLVLSTHGIMYYHRDPEDYWRWTRVGLEKLVTERGFEVVETIGVLGLAAASLQLFQDGTVWRLPRRLQRAYVVAMQLGIRLTDRWYSDEERRADCLTIALRAVRVEDDPSPATD
jgi:SAM-dependent methyltransferase